MNFLNSFWAQFALRIGFIIFVLPTLAAYVPNLDPMIWIGIAFGCIFLLQGLNPVPSADQGSAAQNNTPGRPVRTIRDRPHVD